MLLSWRGYLLAIGLVALATWFKHLAQPDIIPANVPITYMAAIVLTAAFFGFGPSILACVLSVFAYDFFFIPPIHTLDALARIPDYPVIAIFLMVAVLVSYLSSNLRHKSEQASEELAARKQSQEELAKYRDHLEEIVVQRTNQLEKANLDLKKEVIERTKAQEELRETRDYLDSLFAHANAPIIVWDPEFRITRFNHAFERLTGRTAEEVMGQNLDMLFPDGSRQQSMDHIRSATSGQRMEVEEIPIQHQDGSVRTVIWNSATLYGGDGKSVISAIAQGQDITERKKAEEELKRNAIDLETANRELESFSYSVSHDLRAPLRRMDGFSQALLEDYADKLDEQGRVWLHKIRSSSQLMAELIDAMLGLSRVTRAELNFQRVDLSEMARSVADRLRDTEPGRQVEFNIGRGIWASGDANLLRLVLENLLGNAFKFTAGCETARIEFCVMQQDWKRVYLVRDNGAGFDMKYADRLFRPFQRLHSDLEFPGTGIGLATVHRIVKRHGGEVWAEGGLRKGATFYFTLDQGADRDGQPHHLSSG